MNEKGISNDRTVFRWNDDEIWHVNQFCLFGFIYISVEEATGILLLSIVMRRSIVKMTVIFSSWMNIDEKKSLSLSDLIEYSMLSMFFFSHLMNVYRKTIIDRTKFRLIFILFILWPDIEQRIWRKRNENFLIHENLNWLLSNRCAKIRLFSYWSIQIFIRCSKDRMVNGCPAWLSSKRRRKTPSRSIQLTKSCRRVRLWRKSRWRRRGSSNVVVVVIEEIGVGGTYVCSNLDWIWPRYLLMKR